MLAAALGLLAALGGCGRSPNPDDRSGPIPEIPAAKAGLGTPRSTRPIAVTQPGIRAALPTAPQLRAMAFSPDGRLLAEGDRVGVVVWDLEGPTARPPLEGQPAPVTSLAFDPRGGGLASAGFRFDPFASIVTTWDPTGAEAPRTLFETAEEIMTLLYSPDGKTLLLSISEEGGKGKLAFLDVESGSVEEATGRMLAPFTPLAISPDGSRIACGAWTTINYQDRGELVLFDAASRSELARPGLEIGRINELAFSPDGAELALSCQVNGGQWRLAIVDPETGLERESIEASPGEASSLAFSPDGALIALGGPDGTVRLLDRRTGAVIRAADFHQGVVEQLAFAPDGATLASGGSDRQIALWDVAALVGAGADSATSGSE